jgi:hypothetical protein
MSDKDIFAEREKALEDEFFYKKEKELIEKMRQRAESEAERKQMAEVTGVSDDAILQDLLEMGYNHETVKLLYLVPLLQVAWIDNITKREQELIYEVARLRGIELGSAAYQQLTQWLNRKPSEAFFQNTLRVVQAMLHALPSEKQQTIAYDLVSYCTQVAEVSGGLLGLGSISSDEQSLLKRIADELEQSRGDAAKELFKKQ